VRLAALVFLSVLVSGCAGKPLPAAPLVGETSYQLGRGDRIKVAVYGQPTLSGEFAVGGKGEVSLPLVGSVAVKGLTIEQFRSEFEMRLARDYFRNPQVSAEIVSFRPVYILGEVAAPGEFRFEEGMTVYSLVARAGGFSYRADKKRVYVRRDAETKESGFALESGSAVQPGDTVRIGEKMF